MTTYILELPWDKPPLSMNDRPPHHMVKANLTRMMRETAVILSKANNLPKGLEHVTVHLNWHPSDRRRRDEENPMPVVKALCDGLVDYGLVDDDTPEYMNKLMPTIHPHKKGKPARMWLTITED